MRVRVTLAAGACGLLLLSATPVQAQLSLGPVVGATTVHLGAASGTDGQGTTVAPGFSLSVVEEGGWGAEFDAGFALGDGRAGELDAQTYIVGVTAIWPKGRLRPFGVAGAGAMRARTCVNACATSSVWTDWAAAGGGGLYYVVSETFALRGDVRYFGTIGGHPDPSHAVRYWRVGVGATLLWSAN